MKKEFFGEPVEKVLNRMMENNIRKHHEKLARELDEIDKKFDEMYPEDRPKNQNPIVVNQVQYVPVYIPIYIPVPCFNRQDQFAIKELVDIKPTDIRF